jgi:hypothetical protein
VIAGDWKASITRPDSSSRGDVIVAPGVALTESAKRATSPILARQYGKTGLTYRIVVGCSGRNRATGEKEADHGEGYYTRGAR